MTVLDTPEAINLYRHIVLQKQLKIVKIGLKFKSNPAKIVRQILTEAGKPAPRNIEQLSQVFDAHVAELKQKYEQTVRPA